jgi:hypothetical protein
MTFGESTSRKSSDHWVWKSLALGVIPGDDGTDVRGGLHRGRVGEERGGKETDRCPLTGSLECSLWISLG